MVQCTSLSPDAQHEVETALDVGAYTSCEPLALFDESDLQNDPFLRYEAGLSEPVVALGSGDTEGECGDRYRLKLRRLTPIPERNSLPPLGVVLQVVRGTR